MFNKALFCCQIFSVFMLLQKFKELEKIYLKNYSKQIKYKLSYDSYNRYAEIELFRRKFPSEPFKYLETA